MKAENQKMECPHCGEEIDLNYALSHQVNEMLNVKQKNLQDEFDKELQNLENEKKLIQKTVSDKVEEERKLMEKEVETKIRRKLESETSELIKEQEKELAENSEKLKELGKMKAELAKSEREKNSLRETLEAENEAKLNAVLEEERIRILQNVESKSELKIKELEKKLKIQEDLTKEMQRKQEQGSMQLQGEVQELAIEDYLAEVFPLDTITEIKKGANGADCIQVVNTYENANCGTIYYESKRTKNFSDSWIEKFKEDIRNAGADLGVLVTEVLPKGMDRMGIYQGIYVCTFNEFKGLSVLVRESLIKINSAIKSQENKGDKMILLYDFLTSNEFRMQIEAIVEGFTQMETDLYSEKRSMARIWKQREKQIQKVITNTVNMYASVRGIAGNAVQKIEILELDNQVQLIENIEDYE